MPERIKVGMADWKIARDQDVLVTFGLGSCAGLGLWDPKSKIAAMAHIMLPDSKQTRLQQEVNPAKFADTAIMAMLERFPQLGIPKTYLQAKLAGGANMFMFSGKMSNQESMNIGERNIVAVKEKLKEVGIPLVAEDTGGSSGRLVEFYAETGMMKIRTALSGEHEI
ncbi:chemotaxis protein CheD [bacterium]|nr:chemotaxis protein CheD [bacterium]